MLSHRRNLLKLLPSILAGAFSYPVVKFIFFQEGGRGKFSIPLKDIKDGITKIDKQNVYIYKNHNDIKVYDAHCTHMGCILNYDKNTKLFNCPCHKSRFDITGAKLRGPAKRDLDKIAFKIKNKTLYIG